MNLDQYKCESCKSIEDNVYTCRNNHMICDKCAKKMLHHCRCKAVLKNLKRNPIHGNLKEDCWFVEEGCKYTYSSGEMPAHVQECRYRPYKCVGTTLGAWSCGWVGMQMEFEKHFSTHHSANESGEFFRYFQDTSVKFDEQCNHKSVHLINAFSRRFVFYYQSSKDTGMVTFLVYLLGRKVHARRYYVEFKIISPKEDSYRKIKFDSDCYSDSEDISQIIEAEKCVTMSHRTVREFMSGGQIKFRLIIKQAKNNDAN